MAAVTVCSDFGAHSCPYKKKHHRSCSPFLYHVGTVRRWLSASPGGFSQIPTHTGLQNSSSSIIEQVAESRGWDSAWLLPCTESQAARTPSHLSRSLWARSYIRFSVPVLAKDNHLIAIRKVLLHAKLRSWKWNQETWATLRNYHLQQ